MPQLATPPPDRPVKNTNGDASKFTPELSPFARMLLKQTDVSFTSRSPYLFGTTSVDTHTASSTSTLISPSKEQVPARPAAHLQQARAVVQSPTTSTSNGNTYAQNANLPHPPSTPSSAPSSTPVRPPVRPPGPAVMIKPKTGAREDYRYIENIQTPGNLSQKKDNSRAAVLRPHERDIADGKIELLKKIVADLTEDKDDLDGPLQFTKIMSPDGEFNVLKSRSMDNLSEKIAGVASLGRFGTLPVDLVMQIQSLLQPTVMSTIKNGLFSHDDATLELTESIASAKLALKASKILLETMIEGYDDHRIRREEIIDTIVDLIKLVKDACIIPIVQSRRSGESQELFHTASAVRQDLQMVLRLCGAVLARFATLIGKHKLSDRAVNALEYLTLELLVEQNSDHERDSVFTIKKFEHFRQKAMDVLAQVFAQHSDLRLSILSGIFSNLEKLPDKKASARQFVSAREPSIMTISALFMRFVQVVATNPSARTTLQIGHVDVAEDEVSDYEPGTSSSKKAKKGNQDNATAASAAQKLTAMATNTAAFIAVQLCERASNTSKSGDKPFRNLLDLFIEDFCNVLGSPQWPAAVMLLQALLVRMSNILKDEEAAKHSVVDKDMALTTMARIGCGVIDFKDRLKRMKQRLDVSQSDLSSRLDRLVNDAMSDDVKERVNDVDLYAFDGPYRMVIESLVDYLDLRPSQEDPHLAAVTGYYVSMWLTEVLKLFSKGDDDHRPQAIRNVQQCLENMIVDSKWLAQK